MARLSNYPPGVTGGIEAQELVAQKCKNGHIWRAAMWYELGGWFYYDEAHGPVCPECGEESLDEPVGDKEIIEYQMAGNTVKIQGVYTLKEMRTE